MVTFIYQDADGVYRGSLSGRRIKGDPTNAKKYTIVGPEVHRERRAENIRAAAARLGRTPRDPVAEAGAAAKPPRPPGVRARAREIFDVNKAPYIARGEPWDGPANINTMKMLSKLHAHNPVYYAQFEQLRADLGAHYFKYNSVSHSIELYNHRQVYKGTYQLPLAIRSKRAVAIPQHHRRSLYEEARPTRVHYSTDEGLKLNESYQVRPPGPKIHRFH